MIAHTKKWLIRVVFSLFAYNRMGNPILRPIFLHCIGYCSLYWGPRSGLWHLLPWHLLIFVFLHQTHFLLLAHKLAMKFLFTAPFSSPPAPATSARWAHAIQRALLWLQHVFLSRDLHGVWWAWWALSSKARSAASWKEAQRAEQGGEHSASAVSQQEGE